MSALRVARLALSLLVVSLLASACLRLSTPDSFSCSQPSDCLSDERCSRQGTCAPKGTCDDLNDCSARQVCTNGKCTAAECYEGNDASCGTFSCSSQRTCNDTCYGDPQCKEGYTCRADGCVPRPNLTSGTHCTFSSDCASNLYCCGHDTAAVCAVTCKSNGEACGPADSCESGHCCPTLTSKRLCQRDACPVQGEGAACSLPEDCQTGLCVRGACARKTCKADTECGAGFCDAGFCDTAVHAIGEPCKTDAWCDKGTCEAGMCRGEVTSGGTCNIDADCKVRRVCCTSLTGDLSTCSAVDDGCKGANGYNCALSGNSQCLSGMCQNLTMCTNTCKLDADCGISPWGSQNSCRKNGAGKMICFPGCRTEAECDDNVDTSLNCTSGVCAGNAYSPAGLQLW